MPKRKCKFNEDLQKQFCETFKTGRFDTEAECKVCRSCISVAHGGKADLTDHLKSAKHKRAVSSVKTTASLFTFFASDASEARRISSAEGTMAFHTVKHHQSYKSMDCTSNLITKLFKESDTAKKFTSARTKTEAIINNVIAPHSVSEILDALEDVPFFGTSTDASNHGYTKIFPLIVQYFSRTDGYQSKLLNLEDLNNETSDTVSQYIISSLKQYNITSKCIAFGGDNTNTNFGGLARKSGNNIFSKLKLELEVGENLLGVGCPAHILHNTIRTASDSLNIDIESIIMKVYNFFSIYTVRVHALKEFCEFVDISYQNLLSHSKTRWLSLFPAIERLLGVYDGVKSYFLSQEHPPKILVEFFESPIAKAYLLFLQSQMSLFNKAILKTEVEGKSVCEVSSVLNDTRSSLTRRLEESFLPTSVQELLSNIDDDRLVSRFNDDVSSFYNTSISYITKWTNNLSDFSTFFWIILDHKPSWNEVQTSLVWLKEKGVYLDEEDVFEEYAVISDLVQKRLEVDHDNWTSMLSKDRWMDLIKSSSPSVGHPLGIVKIVQYYFAIPSHNANVERVFSLMNAQWSKERNRLCDSSIKAILQVQYNYKNVSCVQFSDIISTNHTLLNKISNSAKYNSSQKINFCH